MINKQSKIPIGGYFEIESLGNGGSFPQQEGIKLNTGRNALEYILASIGNINKIYIPYYTCEVVLEPINKLGLSYSFYHIDQNLEIADEVSLLPNEYILYTNYFGIKDFYVQQLALKFNDNLIVDCAQALYSKHIEGIKTFYSPRKYVGISDGAIAYISQGISLSEYEIDNSDDRMSHLYIRKDQGPQAGYADFRKNANKLKMQPILNMSLKTREMLDQIDFDNIKEHRLNNYKQLHSALSKTNKIADILSIDKGNFECPMIYPYWTSDKDLKSRLISAQVFVATYWPNVLEWTQPDMLEYELANNLLAIPCDQRYSEDDMNRIIELICK